jgi:sugar/nucleoside kinase (ribokinase family)
VLVAGTVAFDLVGRLPELPEPERAVRLSHLVQRHGGCGGNVAMGLARLGHRPRLVASVGPDFAGSPYERALRDAGVDLSHLVRDGERGTARAIMVSDPEGRQLILYDEGAMPATVEAKPVRANIGMFSPGEFRAYPKLMDACDVSVFDPGQEMNHRPMAETLACVERADIVICNRAEADRIVPAAGGLAALTARLTAFIVTDREGQTIHTSAGARAGAGARGGEGEGKGKATLRSPAAPAEMVDPTGAGDAFRAGFIHGLASGWDLPRCCRFGSVIAAFVVEKEGAQDGLPTLPEAREREQRAFRGP